MANTIDLRHIPRTSEGRIAVGEGGHSATSSNLFGGNTSQDVVLAPRHIRERIWEFVAGQTIPVTRAEIAAGVGCKKAPWINTHIEQLVSEGWLLKAQQARPGQVLPTFWYKAAYPQSGGQS